MRYQFYAIRHQDYFNHMLWGEDLLIFYQDVAAWHDMEDGPKKKEKYAKLIVDAFRLQARSSQFLKERLRTERNEAYDSLATSRNRREVYVEKPFQLYEQVWLLFDTILIPEFERKYQGQVDKEVEAFKLLGQGIKS